ncbi:MAG TPA: hypothetical protein PLH33_03835, partial [Chitinophagaceae bacterium]|nr:hypothetical protein [Chitinophagaceae bacterium]
RAFQTKEINIKDASKTIPLGIAKNLNPFANGNLAKEEEIVDNLKNLFILLSLFCPKNIIYVIFLILSLDSLIL